MIKVKSIQSGFIFHKYYEKDTKDSTVVHKYSDINERAKRTIHTQEIIRILRNTSRELSDEVREIGVKQYVRKLKK